MKKKLLALTLSAITALSLLTGCGAANDTYQIGVLQLTQHAALDAANEGFIAALDASGIKYEVDQQNASGDSSTCVTVADKFVNDKKDLIYTIATPAAQAVAGATSDIPIVGSAITDYVEAGLINSNDAPGGNITGSSDMNPIDAQLELLMQLVPDAKTIGVFYSADEDNSILQANLFTTAAEAKGLTVEKFTISSSNEIQTVVQSMEGKVDACWIPTDNKLAAGMATVAMIANEIKLPVIPGESNMVVEGGLATYGLDYYQLGYLAGEMAVEILKNGKKPADMPIQFLPADKCELTVNEETAKAIGVDVSGLK
ncbi:MAG: ABC transporter substrate-binding protein [Lachnospiraceae bacterium]|nr:ABC transporter substrate-binding protein [Lachnospiraceae bacterium]MBR4060976.1 ABC transporter substrate-binding protein [Lachnospiraceae bacterium]